MRTFGYIVLSGIVSVVLAFVWIALERAARR